MGTSDHWSGQCMVLGVLLYQILHGSIRGWDRRGLMDLEIISGTGKRESVWTAYVHGYVQQAVHI